MSSLTVRQEPLGVHMAVRALVKAVISYGGAVDCVSAFLFEVYSFKRINQAAIFDRVLHYQVASVGQS